MNTVYGNLLVMVRKIDDGIYAHYALKDAAELIEEKNRMLELMKRYNTILTFTAEMNSLLMRSENCKSEIKEIVHRLVKIDGVLGVALWLYKENKREPVVSVGSLEDENAYVVELILGERDCGKIVIHFSYELSDDEFKALEEFNRNLNFCLYREEMERRKSEMIAYLKNTIVDFGVLVDGIRNPLTVLMNIVDLNIEDSDLKEKLIAHLKRIESTTKKIDDIWNQGEAMLNNLKD